MKLLLIVTGVIAVVCAAVLFIANVGADMKRQNIIWKRKMY